MKWFNNMKIGLKLKLSFAILSLFIIIVGYVGINNMEQINENTEHIYKTNVIGIKDMSQIKSNIITINLKMLQLINEKDKLIQAKLQQDIVKLKDEDNSLLEDYNKLITTSTDRKMFQDFGKILAEYRLKREELLFFINNEKYNEALNFYPELEEVNDRMVNALNKYVEFNVDSAKKYYDTSNSLYRIIYSLNIFIIIFVLLFGTFISFAISSIISKQINKLLVFANAIEKGDLSKSADIYSEDELGGLAKALNHASLARKQYELNLSESYQQLEASYEEILALEEELRENYTKLTISKENLRKSEEWYKLIAESSYDALVDWDIKNDKKVISERWYELLGYEDHEKMSIDLMSLIHPDDVDNVNRALKEHWDSKSDLYKVEFRIKNKAGDYIWILSTGKTLFDEQGKPYRFASSNKDITEIKKYENKLQYIAYHDYLTDLPNRQYMYHKFNNDFINKENLLTEGAILFIDLDNFKYINDSMGHNVGDELLRAIGERLKTKVNNDNFLVRIGGDEFIFGINNMPNERQIEIFARETLDLLNEPFEINSMIIKITASMGISVFPKDGLNIDTLLKKADMAMYESKYHRKNRYTFFNETMNNKVVHRMEIESNLRNALANKEFILYYQPQVDVNTGRLTSFEALIRWNNPKLGFISPIHFIEIAEENQMIIDIGNWVIKTACEFIKELHTSQKSSCYVSVNVSVLQFLQTDFIDNVLKILDETNLPPQYLELEITESIYIKNYEIICRKLVELRKKGIRIALDDFGKGYSSLSYLKELPIDTLKIDKSFIDDVCNDGNKSLVEDIIKMGHKMELNIIAEGVETSEQYNYLKEAQCNAIQGYLFSKPVEENDAIELLNKNFI